MTSRRTIVAALLLICTLAVGCTARGARGGRLDSKAYPGELIDSTALPDGLFYRQRIEARYGDQKLSFAAVLQTEAGVLSLLAMTPYGTRAFLLEQHGQSIRYQSYVDYELPFPVRFILVDVHRTLFRSLPVPPYHEGEWVVRLDSEVVREVWRDGRLHQRTFERVDGRPAGVIFIRYVGGMRERVPPERIELENGWFGYRLVIHTLPE
jgi:hypothetical protein